MKYKLKLTKNFSGITIYMLSEDLQHMLWIFTQNLNLIPENIDSEGYWLPNSDWKGTPGQMKYNQDYLEHRDEYIAECKKLLVKEML